MKRFVTGKNNIITKKQLKTLLSSQSSSTLKQVMGENVPRLNKPESLTSKKIPDSFFFTKLKEEEKRQFPHTKRHKFNYLNNHSAALSLPCSSEQLIQKQNDPQDLLELSKTSIIEHANRRVDLFFYTLIAYYQTSYFPVSTHTELQYGKGRATADTLLTEACHSSFTPSLLDNTIYHNKEKGEKLKSLLSETHLMDSLNATVELPPFVNELDDILENICRPQCIDLIRRTALGTINPVEGLTLFLQMMHDVLADLKEKSVSKASSSCLPRSFLKQKSINTTLIDLVTQGTLSTTFSSETQAVTDEYVQLLLRVTPDEKRRCGKQKNKEKVYLNKIAEIHDEILQSRGSQIVSTTR